MTVCSAGVETVVVEPQGGTRPIAAGFGEGVLILPTDLDGVIALDRGVVLLPVIGCVRSGYDRVSLDTAHDRVCAGAEITQIVDRRDPEVFLIRRIGT